MAKPKLNYYLMAEQLVPVDEEGFDHDVQQFVERKGFKRLVPTFDNELVLALKSQMPIVYDSYTRADVSQQSGLRKTAKDSRIGDKKLVYQYLHLWRVEDINDLALADVMIRCADDDLYTSINSKVVREIQNFVIEVNWLTPKKDKLLITAGDEVAAVSRRFRSVDMGRYLSVVGSLFHSMEEQGWALIGYYQNVTGPLNSVTELWQRRPSATQPPHTVLNGLLAKLPANFRKFEDAQYEATLSFDLTPYDPHVKKSQLSRAS